MLAIADRLSGWRQSLASATTLPLLLGAVLVSMSAPSRAFPQETPVFRSGVQLVEISVAVRDKQGSPSFGLTAADFVLLEDGIERKVDIFTAPVSAEAMAAAQGQLPEGTYTNAPEANRDSRGIVMVLLDTVNTCVGDQMRAKLEVVKFLRKLPPNQRVALYSLGRTFRVVHDFTSDPETLIARLNNANATGANTIDSSSEFGGLNAAGGAGFASANSATDVQQWMSQGDVLANQFQYKVRVQNSIRTIKAIAEVVEPLPGKKTLLWLSGGFPQFIGIDPLRGLPTRAAAPIVQQFNLTQDFARMLETVNRVGLTIYAVDSRGLVPAGGFAPDSCDGMDAANTVNTYGVLVDAAEKTGGRMFRNTNDLAGSLRKSFDEINATYSLGFYVPEERRDSKRHRLQVRLRQEGYELSYRDSYLIEKPGSSKKKGKQKEEKEKPAGGDPLLEAARSPVDSIGVTFLASLHPAPAEEGKHLLQVSIPANQLQFESKDGKFVAMVKLLVLPLRADGNNFDGNADLMRLALDEAQLQQIRQTGVAVKKTIAIPEGATTIRVVLQDQAYGAIGSLSIPVKR